MNRNQRIVFICLVVLTALVLATFVFANKKCPKCGVINPDVAKYCKDCGEKFPEKKKAKSKAKAKPKAKPKMTYIGKNSKGHKEYRWNKDGSTMILIPAGEFWMGSPSGEGSDDEHPRHKVYLNSYYIDKCEVTNAQYKKFCDATDRTYPEDPGWSRMNDYFVEYADYPVVNVSWDDAVAYAVWAGKGLPTEAQWEKAARGSDGRMYPWGNEEPDAGGYYRCNYDPGGAGADGYEFTAPVGSYERGTSPHGVHDMAGNVWEWCSDWRDSNYYGRSPSWNPTGPESGKSRVFRGGSWYFFAGYVRCAFRNFSTPSLRYTAVGFRCSSSP